MKTTMKKKHLSIIVLLIMSGFLTTATLTFAQGSLTPPGAPSPTMKSLDQLSRARRLHMTVTISALPAHIT